MKLPRFILRMFNLFIEIPEDSIPVFTYHPEMVSMFMRECKLSLNLKFADVKYLDRLLIKNNNLAIVYVPYTTRSFIIPTCNVAEKLLKLFETVIIVIPGIDSDSCLRDTIIYASPQLSKCNFVLYNRVMSNSQIKLMDEWINQY